MIFKNLLDQTRAHLQLKFELLDVNGYKFNKLMKYGNITMKFMKNWRLEYHVEYFMWKLWGHYLQYYLWHLPHKKVMFDTRKMKNKFFICGIVSLWVFPQSIAHKRPPCKSTWIFESFLFFYNLFQCVVKIAWMINHIKWLGIRVFFVGTTYIPNVKGENDLS